MAWIESHQSLSRHRKTVRVSRMLRCDRIKVVGHLHELWWWALDNADINGRLEDITAEELSEAAGWTKDAGDFVEALLSARFLESENGTFILHNWYRYAGKLMEKREKDRVRKRGSSGELHGNSNGIPTELRGKSQAPTNQPTNQPAAVAASATAAADDSAQRLMRAWEGATGTTVTRQLADRLDDWLERLPEAAILKAITETGNNGAKRWSYTEAILERFHKDGWGDRAPKDEPKPERDWFEEQQEAERERKDRASKLAQARTVEAIEAEERQERIALGLSPDA